MKILGGVGKTLWCNDHHVFWGLIYKNMYAACMCVLTLTRHIRFPATLWEAHEIAVNAVHLQQLPWHCPRSHAPDHPCIARNQSSQHPQSP